MEINPNAAAAAMAALAALCFLAALRPRRRLRALLRFVSALRLSRDEVVLLGLYRELDDNERIDARERVRAIVVQREAKVRRIRWWHRTIGRQAA